MNWTEIESLHRTAAADIAAAAERIPDDQWPRARAAEKWSPAEVLEHLNLTYEVLLRELAGGEGMKIRTKWWQRHFLRFTVMPKILRGGSFPARAPAPRELRPAVANPDRAAAIAAFRQRADQFTQAAEAAHRNGAPRTLTHAYFGRASIADAVLFCARHLQHHRAQLRGGIAA